MLKRRGIVIHDTDCGDYWAARLETSGLNVVGVHPAGGRDAHLTLAACAEFVESDRFLAFRERMNRARIAVEFEMHALSWMLPRGLFETRPEWFRFEDGARTPSFNCCASCGDALEYISARAARLVEIFPSDTHLYHFWPDDVSSARCACGKCRDLSASDQALALTNAIAEGVRRTDPEGRTAYLAYCATLPPPAAVVPSPGVFLEFAPFKRDFVRPLFDPGSEKNAAQARHLPELLRLFGTADAEALDYWVDNSLFSNWTLPPRRFKLNEGVCRADVGEYARLGFESVTSFGCFLGENYHSLWGAAPIEGYFKALTDYH